MIAQYYMALFTCSSPIPHPVQWESYPWSSSTLELEGAEKTWHKLLCMSVQTCLGDTEGLTQSTPLFLLAQNSGKKSGRYCLYRLQSGNRSTETQGKKWLGETYDRPSMTWKRSWSKTFWEINTWPHDKQPSILGNLESQHMPRQEACPEKTWDLKLSPQADPLDQIKSKG